ncbi:hypothetical protein Tco_1118871 [Tanacetum coccineum]
MTTPIIDLTVSQPVSTTVQAPLPTSTATVTAITTTTSLLPPPTQPQQGSSYLILIQRIDELEQHMADLLQDNFSLANILSHSHAPNILLSLPDDRDLHCSDCRCRNVLFCHLTLAPESSKRPVKEELDQESSKRQKIGKSSKLAEEPRDKKADELDDLVMLWSLVKEKFNSTKPTDDKEREIWVELKKLFKPDTDDELWKLQKHILDLTWMLYDSCGVHHVSTEKGIDIYMLVENEYPLSRGTLTLMLVAKLLVEQDNEMSKELFRKIFMQAKIPRR